MFFLIAKDNEWAGLLSSLDMFSDDFMEEGRIQPEVQVGKIFNEFTEKKIPYQILHWCSSQT